MPEMAAVLITVHRARSILRRGLSSTSRLLPAQLRDPDLDVACWGRQQLGTVTVALDHAGRGPLPMLRTDPGGQLRLDHLLKGCAEDLTDRRRERAIDLGQSTGEFG